MTAKEEAARKEAARVAAIIEDSAFPIVVMGPNGLGCFSSGMTLRDWFAGQALAGMNMEGAIPLEAYAADAYTVADAMLRRRDKKKEA